MAYALGSWFIAYLISEVGEETYLVNFYDDLDSRGLEGAFLTNFGKSSSEFLDDFHAFLDLSLDEQLAIIP